MVSLYLLMALACAAEAPPRVLARAYSHNDYAQARPLQDALDRGFMGVEADVHLVNGEFLVGHEDRDLKPGNTLRRLYLEPLRARVRANGGRVHAGGPKGFLLMVEFKSDGEESYRVLRVLLKEYEGMLTAFTPDSIDERAVTVAITGKRPTAALRIEASRLAALDGDLGDLDQPDRNLFPVISDYWWKILGPKGLLDRIAVERLGHYVRRAHSGGRQIRFYGVTNAEWAWRLLYDAGVDRINADDLDGLQKFLLSKPAPLDLAQERVGEVMASPLP